MSNYSQRNQITKKKGLQNILKKMSSKEKNTQLKVSKQILNKKKKFFRKTK